MLAQINYRPLLKVRWTALGPDGYGLVVVVDVLGELKVATVRREIQP